MATKKTKEEALGDLLALRGQTGRAAKASGNKRVQMVHDAAYLGAAGLIMLDPLNRLADQRIVLPVDMVCIPAYQAYMIQGVPSLQIYVRAGETILPTGGNVKDVEEALQSEGATDWPIGHRGEPTMDGIIRKEKVSAYQRKYKKAFKQVAPKHKKKDGTWKKGGFKKAVKEAHAKARNSKK